MEAEEGTSGRSHEGSTAPSNPPCQTCSAPWACYIPGVCG